MRSSHLFPLTFLIPVFASQAASSDTVNVAMHYTEEQAAPLLACFDRYEAANPDTTINYQQISYGEYLQTILTARIGGTAPDIYNIYSIWGAQMVDNGVLAPAPASVQDYVATNFLEETAAAATLNGILWGIPTEVSVLMQVSNMEHLDAAGFGAPPTTWDALQDVAAAITTRNAQNRIETAGFAFAESSTGAGLVHPFYALMFSQGMDIYSDDFSAANLNSPEAVNAVELMASMVQQGITERSVDAFDFPAGGIGTMFMANWYKSAIQDGLAEGFEDVVVSQIPMGEDWKTLQYAFYLGVDSGSSVQDRAWDIIRWTNSSESAAMPGGPSCVGEMMDSLGALTGHRGDRDALGEMDDFTQAYWDALQEGRAISQPNVLQASEIERLIARTIDTVIAGEAEAQPAMDALNAQVEDILSEFY